MAAANYYWRLVVTGACFFLFSSAAMVAFLTVLPAVSVLPIDSRRRQRWARWMIHKFFSLLVVVLTKSGVMRLQARGVERLQQASAVLVLANHPTYVDVVVLLATMPRAISVVKGAWWRNPFVAGVIGAAGYIRNADPEQVIADCDRAMREGCAVIVFPEGTRTAPHQPLKFLRGAAHIALRSGRQIVPVLLHCDPPTLTKGSRWYDIPPRPFHFFVSVREPLAAAALADIAQPPVVAARRLTHALESYFTRELEAL
jgi:1-acyl-sn-glycerol-3-phosphate acyltransferase